MKKNILFAAFIAFFALSSAVIAAEKNRTDLQTQIDDTKLTHYNAHKIHDTLTDIADSSFNIQSDGLAPFSTDLIGNPLAFGSRTVATVASINAGTVVLISGDAGKTIYPVGSVMMQASGTASGATSVTIKCSGGNVLSTFPIGMLANDVPVGSFSSIGGGSNATNGAGLVEGCGAGENIVASVTGTLGTTTHLFITVPYAVQ